MLTITKEVPIGTIVSKYPQSTNYFIKEDIDFCCGGDRPLKEAVQDSDKTLDVVLKDLEEISQQSIARDQQFEEKSSVEIINHIVSTHHHYLKNELPIISKLAFKVLLVHGENHEELFKVHELFNNLSSELQRHTVKEEKFLFPAIKEKNKDLINELIDEHDVAGDLVKEIKEVTDHYTLPDDACESYQLLYEKLETLELDIYHHVHLENNILFKKLKGEL